MDRHVEQALNWTGPNATVWQSGEQDVGAQTVDPSANACSLRPGSASHWSGVIAQLCGAVKNLIVPVRVESCCFTASGSHPGGSGRTSGPGLGGLLVHEQPKGTTTLPHWTC